MCMYQLDSASLAGILVKNEYFKLHKYKYVHVTTACAILDIVGGLHVHYLCEVKMYMYM